MLTYRPLLREQVPIFASLHYQCWMETYPGLIPQAYLDQMSLEKNIVRFDALYDLIGAYQYLVYEDEKPVGLFDISPAREQVEDCLSEVQGLYLSKASHGQRHRSCDRHLCTGGLTRPQRTCLLSLVFAVEPYGSLL